MHTALRPFDFGVEVIRQSQVPKCTESPRRTDRRRGDRERGSEDHDVETGKQNAFGEPEESGVADTQTLRAWATGWHGLQS